LNPAPSSTILAARFVVATAIKILTAFIRHDQRRARRLASPKDEAFDRPRA
jgi:hypothetical protein